MSGGTTYSIGDLASAAGRSRRTLHFYVQRELLPPPDGRGRGARYTAEHLARLLQIKTLQEKGVPLEEIKVLLPGPPANAVRGAGRPRVSRRQEAASLPGSSWFRQPLVAGYELHVGGGRRPLTARQLAALSRALGEIVDNGGEEG